MLGTLDPWLMSRLSQQPTDPAYYIEDCRISYYTRQTSFRASVVWLHTMAEISKLYPNIIRLFFILSK